MDWGDLRSAVHSTDYAVQARAWAWCTDSNMRHYIAAQEQWMHAQGFYELRVWCHEIYAGSLEHMAHVAYLIMAGGYSEAWMHYAVELLKDVNNGPANAADVIWWWCSASDVLFQRLQDAGHTGVERDHVWQLLCSAARWEICRPAEGDLGHESLGLTIETKNGHICTLWPCTVIFDRIKYNEKCLQRGWQVLSSDDWVVCVSGDGVCEKACVDLSGEDPRDKTSLRGIEYAKRALGTWVEEDDSIWGGE